MLKIKGLEGFKQPANPAFTSAAPKAGEFLGRPRERKPGQKVHICVKCGSPIAIYGQLLPCRHAFCLNCAHAIGQTCYLCFQKVKSIRRVVFSEQALFPCGVCLRSYDTREELAQAVKEAGGKCCQSQANSVPTPMM